MLCSLPDSEPSARKFRFTDINSEDLSNDGYLRPGISLDIYLLTICSSEIQTVSRIRSEYSERSVFCFHLKLGKSVRLEEVVSEHLIMYSQELRSKRQKDRKYKEICC
ncbi:hypothetical protein ABKN59_012062 [Abortiporus biennis]